MNLLQEIFQVRQLLGGILNDLKLVHKVSHSFSVSSIMCA